MGNRRLMLMSNVTTAMLEQRLSKKFDVCSLSGYDTWMFEMLNENSMIYTENADAVLLLLHGAEAADGWNSQEEGFAAMEEWLAAIERMLQHIKKTPVFLTTMDLHSHVVQAAAEPVYEYQWEAFWYQSVQNLSETYGNAYVFDLRNLIADVGRNTFYSPKMWYMGSMPYSITGMKAIVQRMEELMAAAYEKRMKCLAVDLDNTLWGGVVGEDGADGIQLEAHKEGARYYDLQKRILEMKKSGVVLAVLSKNNEEDVMEVFEKHPYMLLKKEDFAVMKINWENKAVNLQQLVSDLNIGMDAVCFLDDNPAEREQMKELCPDVTVLPFPEDTTLLAQNAEDFYRRYFQVLRATGEDRKKAEMYRQEMQRKEVRKQFGSVDDYLKNLEMEAVIHKMTQEETDRVVQLCNKTNQFNLTTRRYTRADIMNYDEAENVDIYTVHSKDRFGDNGLTGLLILKKEDKKAVIDTFLMSCRVMGRKLEQVIINACINAYCEAFNELYGEFIETPKNKPVAHLYDDLGFELTEEKMTDGHLKKSYRYCLRDKRKQLDCYKSIVFEG